MSRTYRRKGQPKLRGWFEDIAWYTSEWVRSDSGYRVLYRRPYPKDSMEYKKGYARYHSDGATHSCKEPGPSWFRNLYSDRPLRRSSKNELRKFIAYDGEYEPMILSKDKLPYWT